MSGTRFVLAVMLVCCWFALTGCGGNAPPESDNNPETDASDVQLFPLGGYVTAEGTKRAVWGYIDRQGRWVIKPRFWYAGRFSEERAFVQYPDGHWEIIDTSGATVAQTGYGEVFSQGRAAVLVAGQIEDLFSHRWGYVDRSGKVVIPGPFASAGEFSEGLAVFEPMNSVVDGRRRGGYIDRDGRIVIPPRFVIASPFAEGLASVWENVEEDGAYIDRSGKPVITGLNSFGGDFSEGLADAALADSGPGGLSSEEVKLGYIDHQGRFIIEPQFAEAEPFSDGRAVVKMTDSFIRRDIPDWGVIDKSGNFIIPAEYAEIVGFSEGRAWVRPRSVQEGVRAKMHLIDLDGRRVSDVEVDSAKHFQDGLSAVYVGNNMGYVDRQGRYVWDPAGPWQADIVDKTFDFTKVPATHAALESTKTEICRNNLGLLGNSIRLTVEHEAVPSLEWLVEQKYARAAWLRCPHADGKRACDYFFYMNPVPPKEVADDLEREFKWRRSRIVACDLDPHATDGNTRCVAFGGGEAVVLTPEEFAKELAEPVNREFAEAFRQRGGR